MTLPRLITFYPLNTQVIRVQGLSDITNGNFLNVATVTATLYDQRGNADPILNGIVLNYDIGSSGNYLGSVPDTFNPAAYVGKEINGWQLVVTAIQAGVQAVFTIPAVVGPRSKQ